jgi:hypothetical protein
MKIQICLLPQEIFVKGGSALPLVVPFMCGGLSSLLLHEVEVGGIDEIRAYRHQSNIYFLLMIP